MQIPRQKQNSSVVSFLSKRLVLEPELVALLMATFIVGFPNMGIPLWWALFLWFQFKK